MDRQDGAPGNWHYALAALLFGRRISAQRQGRDMHFDLTRLAPSDAYKLLVSTVVPPRIAQSPVSFECRRITGLSLGPRSTLEIGRVIHIHIRDDLVDPEKFYVQTDKLRLIGRMHGRGWYARTSDLFSMDRMSLAEWKDRNR